MRKKIFSSGLILGFLSFLCAFTPLSLALFFELQAPVLILITLACLLIAIIIIPCLAKIFSKKITAPIEELDIDSPDVDISYKEIDNLIRKIRRQNKLIDLQMLDLRRRQVEFTAITENMAEGIVILDNKSEILSYNSAAARILGSENVREGEHFISLSRSRRFVSTVGKAFEGSHAESSMNIGQRVYELFANPVMIENEVNGVVIVILDVTEREKRDEMRREFTSNVSHELKTPLTTISGISEMFMGGIIASQDIPKFAKSIHDESDRLLTLINDIIKLSRLDESVVPDLKEDVRIDLLAEEIKNRLLLPAAERNIEIEINSAPASVFGSRSVLTEMIYNLTDNAIKYNKEGGSVTISVSEENGVTKLCVADTGIGIPSEYIPRIFERFYRVDKSHSREVGGTGLGLSIVKHAAEYHNASISVESAVGEGTSITVTFN